MLRMRNPTKAPENYLKISRYKKNQHSKIDGNEVWNSMEHKTKLFSDCQS